VCGVCGVWCGVGCVCVAWVVCVWGGMLDFRANRGMLDFFF